MTKDRPILMSTPMVRSSLDDTKTQTRRVVKPQPPADKQRAAWYEPGVMGWAPPEVPSQHWHRVRCPYGKPGDRLWVRETFFAWGRWETRFSAKKGRDEWHFIDLTQESGPSYLYAADGVSDTKAFIKRRGGVELMYWKRPAIFMPRAACRITLEITGVRVEKLKDISEADAIAEGVNAATGCMQDDDAAAFHRIGAIRGDSFPIARYAALWEAINGPGSWEANPFVWVIEFKRIQP